MRPVGAQWRGERTVEVGQPVPAPDALHGDDPLLRRRRVRPDLQRSDCSSTFSSSVCLAAGGFGIANEKKWGYAVAVGGAVLQVVLLFAVFGTEVFTSTVIISLLFDGALVALLLHPMSREYQRIWFK